MISEQPSDMNEEEKRNSQEGNEEDFEFTERNMEIQRPPRQLRRFIQLPPEKP